MKNPEHVRAALTSELLPSKEGFADLSEWLEEARRARAKAHKAVEMAADRAIPLDVAMPPALVAALRSISCAPSVHWVLDLVDKGLEVGVAVAITEALDVLQQEEDCALGYRPWGWARWGVRDGVLMWGTGSGRTYFEFGPTAASLERFAWGEEVTGSWTWSAEGHLGEGWVHPRDQRASQLTSLLGAVGESPEESELAQELELQAVTAERKEAHKARKGKERRKTVSTERAKSARRRTMKRRADRRRKAADTWDRPVA